MKKKRPQDTAICDMVFQEVKPHHLAGAKSVPKLNAKRRNVECPFSGFHLASAFKGGKTSVGQNYFGIF